MKKINRKNAPSIRVLWVFVALLITFAGCISGEREEIKNAEMLAVEGDYEVISEEVAYFDGSVGLLARPSGGGNFPGVVMIHEWWGLNENIKDMAKHKQLASKGYVVLAVDLHGGRVATTSDEARQLVSSLDYAKAAQNMRAAASYLRTNYNVGKVASLGWCFGGGQSLQLALSGEPLDATVIYYGSLVTDQSKLSAIRWPVLGIFGDKDQSIPVASVNEFESALKTLGIENDIYIYSGVGHAFANPSGMNYAPVETKDAWDKTVAFLDRHLKGTS